MGSTHKQPTLKEFMKLNSVDRSKLLHGSGLLLDSDVYKGERINLFYFGGYFVEEILNYLTWELIEVIPYKTGYRLETFQHLYHRSFSTELIRNIG